MLATDAETVVAPAQFELDVGITGDGAGDDPEVDG